MHIRIEESANQTVLLFEYEARNDSEFSVTARIGCDYFFISCDAWHEDYQISDDAEKMATKILAQLITLFNGQTKLMIWFAGNSSVRWELMYNYRDETWASLGTTGLIFYNYFAKKHSDEKINRLIDERLDD